MKFIGDEIIKKVKLDDLYPFPDHPFQIRDDDSMQETVESVKLYGVLSPILVRERDEGGYEIISGHRRKRACELAGIEDVPVIVRNMDRDSAIIAMVDANIQREYILPSEKAAAYKMKLDAIKRQGERKDLTCAQVGHKLDGKKSVEKVAEDSGDSKTQVQRYIRLNELQPDFQKMVDDSKLGMTPAVEISYLKPEEQTMLLDAMDAEQSTPSLSQAKRMKEMSKAGSLTEEAIFSVMREQKRPEQSEAPIAPKEIVLPLDSISKFFPKNYKIHDMERMIYKLLDSWQKKKQRQHGER